MRIVISLLLLPLLFGGAVLAQSDALRLEAASDRTIYNSSANTRAYVEAKILAPAQPGPDTGTVRNIALVLDRSGSMAGEPIQALRQAVSLALGTLAERDVVSIILFGSEVETVLSAQRRDELGDLDVLLAKIEPAGGAARAVRDWTLGHLYARFDGTAAWLSIGRVSEAKLGRVAELVRQAPDTTAFWRNPGADGAPLVYVLPETWYVPEIPMAFVGDGDHANAPVAENSRYKAIIMATDAPGRPESAGWLRGVRHRRALMELLVDPVAGTVDRVAPPPAHAPYEGIPVPLF